MAKVLQQKIRGKSFAIPKVSKHPLIEGKLFLSKGDTS